MVKLPMVQCLSFHFFSVSLTVSATTCSNVGYFVDRCLGLHIAQCGAKCLRIQLCYHLSQRVYQWLGLHINQCVDKCVRF